VVIIAACFSLLQNNVIQNYVPDLVSYFWLYNIMSIYVDIVKETNGHVD